MPEFPAEMRNASEEEARAFIREKTGKEAVHAYKAFRLGCGRLWPIYAKWTEYIENSVHSVDGPLITCRNGYHACLCLGDVGNYIPADKERYVIHNVLVGDYVEEGDKVAARYLYIGKQFTSENGLVHRITSENMKHLARLFEVSQSGIARVTIDRNSSL